MSDPGTSPPPGGVGGGAKPRLTKKEKRKQAKVHGKVRLKVRHAVFLVRITFIDVSSPRTANSASRESAGWVLRNLAARNAASTRGSTGERWRW